MPPLSIWNLHPWGIFHLYLPLVVSFPKKVTSFKFQQSHGVTEWVTRQDSYRTWVQKITPSTSPRPGPPTSSTAAPPQAQQGLQRPNLLLWGRWRGWWLEHSVKALRKGKLLLSRLEVIGSVTGVAAAAGRRSLAVNLERTVANQRRADLLSRMQGKALLRRSHFKID